MHRTNARTVPLPLQDPLFPSDRFGPCGTKSPQWADESYIQLGIDDDADDNDKEGVSKKDLKQKNNLVTRCFNGKLIMLVASC